MSLSIVVIVGSLRRQSFNRQLAEALVRLPAAEGHAFSFPDIGTLPLYNQDDDADQPASAKLLKEQVRAADGVLFVTPEYNRSIPGVLKNAIDHASRPYGQSAWAKKPGAVIGTSQGATGTAMAQQHLRLVCHYLDMPILMQPETYVRWTDGLIDAEGEVGPESREFLNHFMQAFLSHVGMHASEGWRREGAYM